MLFWGDNVSNCEDCGGISCEEDVFFGYEWCFLSGLFLWEGIFKSCWVLVSFYICWWFGEYKIFIDGEV